ncbi:peptidase [Labrys neptuniae]
MTYCVGISVREGLVMIADTRTNAGIDNIATFRKLHVFEEPGERVLAVCTSGNLSISQAVLDHVQEGIENPDTGAIDTLMTMPSMFKVAQLIGRAIRLVYATDGRSLEEHHSRFDVAFLCGGQIKGGKMRLFMIYSAGNFIEVTADTPYLQIGEHKYGKPILDRAVNFETEIPDALKIGLISMDSTMRSNLGVGMPIDILTVRRDALKSQISHRIEPGEPYFHDLRERWSAALRAAHIAIPKPPYISGKTDVLDGR